MDDSVLKEKNFYKNKIVEMVNEIENMEFLEMIYGFVKRLNNQEAGE